MVGAPPPPVLQTTTPLGRTVQDPSPYAALAAPEMARSAKTAVVTTAALIENNTRLVICLPAGRAKLPALCRIDKTCVTSKRVDSVMNRLMRSPCWSLRP